MKIKKKRRKKLFLRLPFDLRKIEMKMKMKNVKLMGERRKLIKNIIPNGI